MNTIDSTTNPWWLRAPAIMLWASVFYVVWNWGKFSPVWLYGDLQGPDSFLRMHQVQNWMAGQNWFDLRAHQMAPPDGADIHWSRLVDVPIAALIGLFELFVNSPKSAWLAAIVWPFILFLATFWAILRLCKELIEDCNPLLVLLFYVLSVSVLAETAPGRIDHHNVQILLFSLALLGLVMKPGWKSDGLVGVVIPLSLSVGMDSAALFLPLLALVGFQWALHMPNAGERLVRIGFVLLLSTFLIYGATVPTDRWADSRCDAYSLFYVVALTNLSIGFLALGKLGSVFRKFPSRVIAGIAVAGLAVGTLLLLFPHCISGPYGNLDPELNTRWLSRVEEAKGILGAVTTSPQRWLGDFLYIWLMAALAAWVTIRNYRRKPEFIVLLCAVLICAVGLFFQIRILRTGIIAAIPFCVAFGMMALAWLNRMSFELAAARLAALGLICFSFTSFFWYSVGNIALGKDAFRNTAKTAAVSAKGSDTKLMNEHRVSCSGADSLFNLANVPKTVVMSDLNTATPIMMHTDHIVIAGPYHRNGAAILAVLDFFETDTNTAKKIADIYGVTHIAYCNRTKIPASEIAGVQLQHLILKDELPDWLTWVSDKGDRLLVLKVN